MPEVAPHPPSIVLVDDSADVRMLLRTQIRMSRQLEVVGEGANGLDAAALADRHRPDVILLDVSMPVVDGLTALPQILAASPRTRVVMYSGFEETGLASEAVSRGAAAFVSKSASFEHLLEQLLDGVDPPSVRAESTGGQVEFQASLAEHLERFREVFDDAAIGMATLTLAGRLVRANRSLAQLLETPADRLVGVALSELAEEPEAIEDALLGLDAGESVVQVEHRIQPWDDRWFRSTLSPVIDARGRPLYIFLQVQDVTRQVAAEAELRRTEARFKLLVEAVEDYAIFMLDPTGHISSWNTGAERIKGYAAHEIIGQHFRIFYPEEKQRIEHPEYELEQALEHGRYVEEGWRVRQDGSRFWALVTITAVRDADGDLVGFAKVTRDTTERREMLERLEEANQQLAELASQQERFFSVTAHELRAPVSVLSGAASTLAAHFDRIEPEDRADLAEAVRHSSEHLRRLLDDLLTASRLQARGIELELEELDVGDHLATTVGNIEKSDDGARISLTVEPDLTIRADPVRLTQMVDNLVLNAVRHGLPPVELRASGTQDTVEVVVKDGGQGVETDLQDRLFERFATASAHSTGLGLYLVRELARAHGGEASYRSDDGAFVLSLPRVTT